MLINYDSLRCSLFSVTYNRYIYSGLTISLTIDIVSYPYVCQEHQIGGSVLGIDRVLAKNREELQSSY